MIRGHSLVGMLPVHKLRSPTVTCQWLRHMPGFEMCSGKVLMFLYSELSEDTGLFVTFNSVKDFPTKALSAPTVLATTKKDNFSMNPEMKKERRHSQLNIIYTGSCLQGQPCASKLAKRYQTSNVSLSSSSPHMWITNLSQPRQGPCMEKGIQIIACPSKHASALGKWARVYF